MEKMSTTPALTVLEHHTTRLIHKLAAPVRVSPSAPFLLVAAPSSRKTDVKNKSDAYMTESENSPMIFRERKILAGDATIKGINSMICEHSRAGITHDEASNCYYEPDYSGSDKGVHHLNKVKMCNYLMCENVDTVTVAGRLHLGGSNHPYSFCTKLEVRKRWCCQL